MNVTIYTTPTCVYCRMAKDYLAENGILYDEKDVAADSDARDAMIQKSGQMGVPVIDFEGSVLVGFDKDQLGELIETRGGVGKPKND